MRDTQEKWKPIEETGGKYSVSNMGRVRNNNTGNVLKPVDYGKGYTKVNLRYGGKEHNRQVHRLVAIAFIPNPENKPQVNHKNGVHDDNRVVNLEWVTGEENRRHAYDTGLQRHKDERYSGYLYGVWKKRYSDVHKWCAEWENYLVFYQWCLDNGYVEGKYVALVNMELGYRPDNCYISSVMKRQNRRETYKMYSCFGKDMTMNEICETFGVSEQFFTYRIKHGMTPEEAVTKPKAKNGRPRKAAE